MLSRSLILAVRLYAAIIAVFVLFKPLFMLFDISIYRATGVLDWLRVMKAGFAMDCSMAAYLAIVPFILLIVAQWVERQRVISRVLTIYLGFISLVMASVFVLDTMLYPYWGFKLDTTPLFYFASSPSLAVASIPAWQVVVGIIAVLFLAVVIWIWLLFAAGKVKPDRMATPFQRCVVSFILLIVTGLLFIPIRGGFTVATMNLSSAYFCNDNRLNHAAVNPMFSLMYSATHADRLEEEYRFMSDERAESIVRSLGEGNSRPLDSDSLLMSYAPLNIDNPDIYIIILESFSSHLFKSLGGEDIATGLDSIAGDGLLFSNIYASSFRTDRGIPAILSGYPGPPSTSLLKDASLAESLPSIASSLSGEKGYSAEYYYGGDPNFTNMKAYLAASGFSTIVGDSDFPISQRLSKWGVPDAPLFEKVKEMLTPYNDKSHKLRVIQTSSSHEPFDVDRSPRSPSEPPEVTAFQYADSCVSAFINTLKASNAWRSSLVILVPDHYGAYPKDIDNSLKTHAIPLILTGGALNIKGRINRVGSQTDIAATLLAMLGADTSDFRFSNNLLDPRSQHYAFFSSRNDIGFVTDSAAVVYNLDGDRIDYASGDTTALAEKAKAYLRTFYLDMARR